MNVVQFVRYIFQQNFCSWKIRIGLQEFTIYGHLGCGVPNSRVLTRLAWIWHQNHCIERIFFSFILNWHTKIRNDLKNIFEFEFIKKVKFWFFAYYRTMSNSFVRYWKNSSLFEINWPSLCQPSIHKIQKFTLNT